MSFQLPPESALLHGLPEPYFSTLVRTVREAHRTTPGGVIDLARGNPELPPPAHVVEALRAAALEPGAHGYPPFAGMPELTEAFAHRFAEVYGVRLDPATEVIVVPGTKTAIALICMALAGRGDTVLVPDPGYPDYYSGVGVAGAQAAPLPLDAAAAFAPDWAAIAPDDLARVRMAFLNYPSNPCGTRATPALFDEAVAWAQRTGVPIVHDLAYGELVFDGQPPLSFLASEGAREVGVELVTMSKTYCMAGCRVGFVCGNPALIERIRTLLDHLTVGVHMPIQHAAIAALRGPQGSVAALRDGYGRRATLIAQALECDRAQGSYYTWLRLPEGLTFERLLHDYRVAVAPGAGFGARGEGWARVSAAVSDEQLEEGLHRLGMAFVAAGC